MTKEIEIRCAHCNRLLAKGRAISLAIKCPRCGTINHLRAESTSRESQQEDHSER
ncbi:MAG: Com family DNA-binding transcriptional regulator [Proteobacteria bacterium]|nr:Com family DNA-binding transcriptional regulator [Pseudomonadota bacterium]